MFGSEELDALETRKQTVLDRCAQQRRALRTASPPLKSFAGWVDMGIDLGHKARESWSVVAPLFSLKHMFKPETGGWIHRVRSMVQVVRDVAGFWKASS